MIRVVETYRDYEDPRALEKQLQDFMKKHPNKSEWSDNDYETYYDLKDRIRFAWDDEEYDMDVYGESYTKGKEDKILLVAKEIADYFKYHNKNLNRKQDGFLDDLDVAIQNRDIRAIKSFAGDMQNNSKNLTKEQYYLINDLYTDFNYANGRFSESYLREYYNQPLHDKLKRDGYTFVGSQGGWYCYAKNALGGGRPTYKAFPTNADSEDAIEDVSYEQVKGKDPMPYDIDAMDYGRGNRGLSYRFAFAESKLTESDFTGDPLLPDVKDVYEELIRMYDVRKDVGYVETAKKMAEYVGGKANVSTSRTSLDNDYMEINWKVYGDFEFDGRKKTSYDGRNSILSDSYGNWLMYIEDLCMAFYKVNGGKGGYTPDLIKAIGKGY